MSEYKKVAYMKHGVEKVRLMDKKKLLNLEAYRGKQALLQTYDQLSIQNDDTKDLTVRIRNLRVRLENRGAI